MPPSAHNAIKEQTMHLNCIPHDSARTRTFFREIISQAKCTAKSNAETYLQRPSAPTL